MQVYDNKLFRDIIKYNNLYGLTLLNTPTINFQQIWGDTEPYQGNALIHASANKYSDMVAFLVNYINPNLTEKQMNWTALHFAAKNGDCETISILLQSGADLNPLDIHMETPVFLACWKGHVDAIRLLLQYKVNINILNLDNQSPYDIAIKYNHKNCANLILQHTTL